MISNVDEDTSYKSFSRDSGHGGSEQEDSPRTHWTNTHHQHHHQPPHHLHQPRYTNSLSAEIKNSYLAKLNRLNGASDGNSNRLNLDNGNHIPSSSPSSFAWVEGNKQLVSVPNTYSTSLNPNAPTSVKAGNGRGPSPWNHTYMEIDHEADPVYEEIERERWSRMNGQSSDVMQVSDLSDEDGKRNTPSDMSRNSSKCYGDSRPLLPYYSQQQQQQLRQQQHQQKQLQQLQQQQQQVYQQDQFALSEDRLRDFNNVQVNLDQGTLQRILMQQHQEQQLLQQQQHQHQQQMLQQQKQQQQQHLSRENLMTVAVLNGEQVVCRLSSPSHHPNSPHHLHQQQQQQQHQHQHQQQPPNKSATPSNSSSLATSPTSNGMPAHIVISRPPHLLQQQLYNET
ncbi:hypothetical protein FHG87_013739 [Trinorchestia longiramus]|nr:hypothetical protein FHG87_013739 [Trinorchestia longiramus]